MTNILFSFLIICTVVIGALSVFALRALTALNEKKLELEMERANKDSEVERKIKSAQSLRFITDLSGQTRPDYCKEHHTQKKLSPGSFNTLVYYRGHAEGMREAIKAVKAIREFPKRNYLDMPQRLTDFMSGVLEQCERQLRYDEEDCIKSTREERVLSRDERDEQQYGIPLTHNAADGDDTP